MCEKNKQPLETAELTDDELEQVSGGNAYLEAHAPDCPHCGTKMELLGMGLLYFYFCNSCCHRIDIEP